MRKWAGPILSILFIALLLLNPFASDVFKPTSDEKENMRKPWVALIQNREGDEKGRGEDGYYITLLKQTREEVDVWLKSLNEKIEREDVTRFEVRFYEILRNILEGIRETIDAKIRASEEKRQKQREKEEVLRDTRQRVFSMVDRG
jgi:hypothetical protein